jgi:hypothetical protein
LPWARPDRVVMSASSSSMTIGNRADGKQSRRAWRRGATIRGLLALALMSLSAAPPLHAQGSVSFVPGPGSPFPAGSFPQAVAAADLNTDGQVDLVTANFSSNNVTILLGKGQGGFAQATGSPVDVGSGPTSIAVGDFNQDGKPDLVVTNLVSSTVTILLGNGQGQFSQASGSPVTVRGGACRRLGACFQFESQGSFTIGGLLSGVPAGAAPTLRVPVVDAEGTPAGTRDVRCGIANGAGRVRCDAGVSEGVFPRLGGTVQVR